MFTVIENDNTATGGYNFLTTSCSSLNTFTNIEFYISLKYISTQKIKISFNIVHIKPLNECVTYYNKHFYVSLDKKILF